MSRTGLFLALTLCACGSTETPRTTATPESSLTPEEVVSIETVAPDGVGPGGSGELLVRLNLADGYHVMSHRPSEPHYIATRVTLESAPGLSFGPPRYPTPTPFRLFQSTIDTFMSQVPVFIPFNVAPDAAPGEVSIRGTVEYQACSEGSCLFPVTRPIELLVNVQPSP